MKEDNNQGKFFCECASGWNGPLCEVPNPVLNCGTDEITVTIDKRMIVSNGLDVSPELISFGGSDHPDCLASLDSDNYTLRIKSPFSANCFTTPSRADGDSGDYIFHNFVEWKKVYDGSNPNEAAIQRKIKLVDFKCQYEDEYLLHMVPIKPAESVIEKNISKGSFEVDMTLWKNSDFERDINGQYSSNPIIRIGQQVCVKMNLKSKLEMPNLVLTAANCWASGTSNPTENDKHRIINKKCTTEEDYTTIVKKNGIDSEVKFCFQVYKWKQQMDQLFIQCQMSICDDSIQFDGSSQCVCPPKSYELNSWFYPNYYDSQLDLMNDYDAYYTYGLYGDDAYYSPADDNYGGGMFYYDYISPYQRKRRSTNEEDEPKETQEQGHVELPTGGEQDALIHPESSSKRKRLEFVGTFKDSETGEFKLPEGIKVDAKSDLIDVGYGPITIKEKLDPASEKQYQAPSVIEIAELDENGEWYSSEEGASNVVLMAVGGALVFALVILGVIVGVYIQFSNKSKDKMKDQIGEQQKVKNFFKNIEN